MKKTTLFGLFVFIGTLAFGQTLETNEIDGFTNNSVKRTSWESINMTMKFTAFFRVSRINDNTYLDLKMMIGTGVFSIGKGQEFMIKLSDGSIVKLANSEFTVTCRGCGAKGLSGSDAQGIQVFYPINTEQIEQLKNGTGTELRIYTKDGYVENDMKAKNYNKIVRALSLVE